MGSKGSEQYAIGIDIGGSKTLVVILSGSGKIVYQNLIKSSADWKKLYELVIHAILGSGLKKEQISTVGIGVAGIVDCRRGLVIDAPSLKWKNFNLLQNVQTLFDFPVILNNDVNCTLWGEKWLGSGKSCQDILLISIGTGMGGAILSNGSLVYGSKWMAGEIGFMIDRADVLKGKLNSFGRYGVAENKVSGTALGKDFSSSKKCFEFVEAGDLKAQNILNEFIMDLSILIANGVSLLNPEKIILSGGVSNSLFDHLELIRSKVSSYTPIPVEIEIGELGDFGAAIGAAGYTLNQIENSYIIK